MTGLRRDSAKAAAWRARSKPLKRSAKGLRRTEMNRSGRLPAMSPTRKVSLPTRREIRADVFVRDGGCVLRVLPGHRCHGPLTPHHLQKSGGQVGPYEAWNLVALCAGANGEVEDRPKWARALGLVVCFEVTAVEAAALREAFGIAPHWRPATEAA